MNRIRAWISANPLVVDTALALVLATASVFGFVSGADRVDAPAAFTIGLLLLESLPLALRRRFPVAVLLTVVGAAGVHIALVPPGEQLPPGTAVLIALYTVGISSSVGRRWACWR